MPIFLVKVIVIVNYPTLPCRGLKVVLYHRVQLVQTHLL